MSFVKKHQDALIKARIDAEVGTGLSLIQSVIKNVNYLLIDDSTEPLLIDIKSRFDEYVGGLLQDADKLSVYLESKKQ